MTKTLIISFLLASQCIVAAAVNYSYDAAGRLIKLDYGAAGSISYTYDAAGNLTSRIVQAGEQPSSAITAGKLSVDGSTIDLTGTNLVPAYEGATLTVTVDGKAARVLSACSASSSQTCKADRITVAIPPGLAAAKFELVVKNGTAPAASFWLTRRTASK